MNPLQPALDIRKLTELVFELSSQLHAERLHRLALEAALVQAGVLDAGAPEKLVNDPALREASRREAGESIAGLMRVMTEYQDERTPLRSTNHPA
jgi:hypothetical protein